MGVSEDDGRLAERYLDGEPDAYREIHSWIRPVVDNRHWGLRHQREDILQEVHKRLVENLSENRFGGRSSLKTYAVQIAKYTCIEFLRSKIRSRAATAVELDAVELADARPGPDARLADAERRALAARAFAQLPESCRQLFHLIFQERLSYQVISERLGIAEGTVKSRAWRCREMLVRKIREQGVGDPT